jgi:hypothetical protein
VASIEELEANHRLRVSMALYSTEIPQMAADLSLILHHIGLSRNPEAPMRPPQLI